MPYQDRYGRLCGFLNKEESEGSGNFSRRYFILDHVEGKLSYYLDSPLNLPETRQYPCGEFNVQSISKVSDGIKQRPKVQFSFIITVAGEQICLQAEEDIEKWQWVEALKNASKITVPQYPALVPANKEWHAADVSQVGYVTEIAGGVVCKMPIQQNVEHESDSISDDDESRSSSSGRVSPPAVYGKGPVTSVPNVASTKDVGDRSKPGNPQRSWPLRSGYCVKQGAVRKSWKRRFFVLHQDALSYYKSDQDKQPLRTIPLSDITDTRLSGDGSHLGRDNLFEIVTSKRTFFIQCDTIQDTQGWIDAINRAIYHKDLERQSTHHQGLEEELSDSQYPAAIWV